MREIKTSARDVQKLQREPLETPNPETVLERRLEKITASDVSELMRKREDYGDSWKKRGGVGAFMMLARKWDRIEKQVLPYSYDVFAAVKADHREEGIIDDIRDLRRYLLLLEEELSK